MAVCITNRNEIFNCVKNLPKLKIPITIQWNFVKSKFKGNVERESFDLSRFHYISKLQYRYYVKIETQNTLKLHIVISHTIYNS